MSRNKNKQKSVKSKSDARILQRSELSMHEKFANLFLISMFTLFPVFMTNMLFNIRKDRLHYFIASTLVYLFFILATYICGIDKEMWPKKLFRLSVTDWGMLGFLLICVISTLLSKYGMEAVTGSKGRDSGLILMAVYVLCYFLVSRYLKYKELPFNLFIITACVVCIIAVLHEFYTDPLKILERIKVEQQSTFITTIGNKNLFSCFVCVVLPVIVSLLVMSKNITHAILYSVSLGICFMGLLVADSDSGYFGLAAFMAVLFVYACGNAERMFKYFLCIFSMLVSCKVLRLVSSIFGDEMKELDKIPMLLIFNNKIYILIALAAVGTIAFYVLKRKYQDKHTPKWVQIVAGSFVGVCAAAILFVFIYFSFIDKTTDLGSLTKYLRLNDQWGTHRGYAWIRSIILFKDGGVKNILVGTGPDTFGQVMKAVYRQDMLKRHGSVFDNAHNEYLQYLVTIGLLGLLAYMFALVSLIVRCIKKGKNDVVLLIVITVVVSYCSQAIFNLATPIVTPYLFVFFGIGEAYLRRMDSINEAADSEQKK